jgi:hypothetical protein
MFTGQKINIQKVLGLIPDGLLSQLAKDIKVDYCSKVLFGQRIFNLLLYGLLTTDRTSQRTLEDLFGSELFKSLFSYDSGIKVARSSISTRLSTIDTEFFRLAYEGVYKEFSKSFSPEEQLKHRIIRVDSSMVAETCSKLKEGLSPGSKKKNSQPPVRQIKFTAAFDGLTACAFDIFTDSKYTSEDLAIPEVIFNYAAKEGSKVNIYTFDRGVAASKTFATLSLKEIGFVGRLKTNRKFEIVTTDELPEAEKDLGELSLLSSQTVHLFNGNNVDTENTYRLIIAERKEKIDTTPPMCKGKVKKKENIFFFITNNMNLTPREIAQIYKQRWDIEVFFRFIKQELNASHFISVSRNGITVMLYMTLIAAMLLQLYKKLNGLGYKTAKRRFTIELWETLVTVIVKECGGNPELINKGYFKQISSP